MWSHPSLGPSQKQMEAKLIDAAITRIAPELRKQLEEAMEDPKAKLQLVTMLHAVADEEAARFRRSVAATADQAVARVDSAAAVAVKREVAKACSAECARLLADDHRLNRLVEQCTTAMESRLRATTDKKLAELARDDTVTRAVTDAVLAEVTAEMRSMWWVIGGLLVVSVSALSRALWVTARR